MRISSSHTGATSHPTSKATTIASAAIVLIVAFTAMMFAAAKPAEANWLTPKQIAPSPEAWLKTSVGLPDGSSYVIWWDGTEKEIRAQKVSPSGATSASSRVLLRDNAEDVAYLSAAAAPSGEVTVAWRRAGGDVQALVEARRITPQGDVYPGDFILRTVNSLVQHVQVATAPDGTSTVVWEDGALGDVVTRRINTNGTIGPMVQWITEEVASGEPRIVAAPEGNPKAGEFYLTWIQIDQDPNDIFKASYVVHGQSLLANGNKGTHNILTPATDIRVVSNYFPIPQYLSDGSTIVTWERSTLGSGIVARRVGANGVPAEETEPFPVDYMVQREHQSVVDSEDRLTVMYAATSNFSNYTYRVRTLSPDGSLGPNLNPFQTSTSEAWGEDMAMTITPNDDIFVGAMIDFEDEDLMPSLRFRHIKPDGTLGPMKIAGQEFYGPTLAPGPGSTANAFFSSWFDGQQGIWTMRFDPNANGKLKVAKISSKPKKVKRGKTATITVKVKNTGTAPVSNVKVCTKLSKSLKKALGHKCAKANTIAAGKTKSVKLKIKVKPKAKAGKTYKPKFVATGKGVKKATKAGKVKVAS